MTRDLLFVGALALLTVTVGCNSCAHEPKNAKKLEMPKGTPKRPQALLVSSR